MSYLPFALISYFLNSIAVTVDKFLLTKTIPDPIIYVFYFSLVSFLVIFAIPFVHIPTFLVITIASVSTICWTIGAYLMFKALKTGQIQRVIPIIGTLTPLILLLMAIQTQSIANNQIIAIIILILGIVFLTLPDLKGKLIQIELVLEVFSAIFFAASYYLLRLAFIQDDFLTVLVWSRPILIPFSIIFLAIPTLRRKLSLHPGGAILKSTPIFIFGQISAGISELLLTFSISLANPAIVNSLQGVKYIYLFIFSLILGKKYPHIFQSRLSGYFLISQILGIGLIGLGLYLLASS